MKNLEEVIKEIEAIKARAGADMAFLRCALFTLSTSQLRGAREALKTLSEGLTVHFMYSPESETTNAAMIERQQFWLEALDAEIQAREKMLPT